MNFTRRGFLGLASAAVAEAVASRIVPPQVVHVAEPLERRLVESKTAFEVERFVMPFASELDGFVEIVEPRGVVSFVARSQILFRPERLIFSACNLESFELLPFVDADGEADMLEPVPATMFDPRSWGARMPLGIVHPGNEIVLSMRNVSKGEREVRGAAMIGSRAR